MKNANSAAVLEEILLKQAFKSKAIRQVYYELLSSSQRKS